MKMKQNNTTMKPLNQNNMKQTAMQELISEMEQLRNLKQLMPSITAIEQCIELALAKLEMEKQQIIDSYIECKRQYIIKESCFPPQFVVKEAEQYYNETFKSE